MMFIASWKPVRKPRTPAACLSCGRGQPPGRFRMSVNAKSDEMRFPVTLASCWGCMKFGLVRKEFAAMVEENPPPEWEKCRAMTAKAMDELGKIWWANKDRHKQFEQAVKLRQGLASEVNKAGLAVWNGEMDAAEFRAVLADWFMTLRDDWRTQPEAWKDRRKKELDRCKAAV